jgi:gliding motility-associated-like protein
MRFAPLFLGLTLLVAFKAHATHNRAGEITYRHVEGTTYEVTITTYTKASVVADRPWLSLLWGDEGNTAGQDSLPRINGPIDGAGNPIGELLDGDVRLNLYQGVHTYAGPGVYTLVVEDPNRNGGVLNIPGSVDVPFCITSQLIIDPEAGQNDSPLLLAPAIENACIAQRWEHNPAAYDPDGDSLSYDLVACAGFDCLPIEGFVQPNEVDGAGGEFYVEPLTGTVVWDAPQQAGEYNMALRIREWRWVSGQWRLVGEVIRDMQINVETCPNAPPVVEVPADTCILQGETLTFSVSASDPNGDNVTVTAIGGPFEALDPDANFAWNPAQDVGTFSWTPGCDAVRQAPYQVVFKATDQDAVPLSDVETVNVKVLARPVTATVATPIGNAVDVDWPVHPCAGQYSEALQGLGGYEVYRRIGTEDVTGAVCDVGMPAGAGYQLLTTVTGLGNNAHLDVATLSFGATYCYRIVAVMPDGARSKVGPEACARIDKGVPVMTTASVEVSDPVAGEVEVRWSPPTDADTAVAFPGPYRYVLEGQPEAAAAWNVLWEGPSAESVSDLDTVQVHVGIDSELTLWRYRVTCFSGEDAIGTSTPAPVPELSLLPADNSVVLSVPPGRPWFDTAYVFHRVLSDGTLSLLDTVAAPSFVDTGLVNGVPVCYRVRTLGTYGSPGILDPIENWSAVRCTTPYDTEPPCPPPFAVEADCAQETVTVRWSDPDCADDVTAFRLYRSDSLGAELALLVEWASGPDTARVWTAAELGGSIAGCWSMTALDSLLPGPDGALRRNESVLGDTVCTDNCPFYCLPNVFTPNLDGRNDRFRPFPWKFVDSVDFRVFNRWGEQVWQTADPQLDWNGTHAATGAICADGTYHYTCTAYTRRLVGIVPERFSGTFQLLGGLDEGQE